MSAFEKRNANKGEKDKNKYAAEAAFLLLWKSFSLQKNAEKTRTKRHKIEVKEELPTPVARITGKTEE